MQMQKATAAALHAARNPRLVLIAGSLIVLVAVGMRHAFGLFLNPITQDVPGINREVFGFAIALQNLIWGIAQPVAGMIADRFGSARVISSAVFCTPRGWCMRPPARPISASR